MFSWFKRKPTAPAKTPPILYFKTGQAAFDYSCKFFRHDPLREGAVRIALVVSGRGERYDDGRQTVKLLIADDRSPFHAYAETGAPSVPLLLGGQLVHCVAMQKLEGLDWLPGPGKDDPRGWWKFTVAAVLAPELIVARGQWRTAIDYRDYLPGGEHGPPRH